MPEDDVAWRMGLLQRLPRLKSETDQFLHLDFLRIVAALGIVVFHWRGIVPEGRQPLWLTHLNVLTLFVDLFFIISGFVIASVYGERMRNLRDYGVFLQRRVARLGPLHWATLLAFVLIGAGLPRLGYSAGDPAKYDMGCVIPSATLTQSMGLCKQLSFNFVSWSISAEMVCYLAFPIFLLLFRRRFWIPAGLGLAAIGLLYGLGPTGPAGEGPWFDWAFHFGFVRALPSFAIGVTLTGCRRWLSRIPKPEGMMLLALGLFLGGGMLGVPKAMLVAGPPAIVACAIAADVQRRDSRTVRSLAPLGSLTYSIYMLHLLVQAVLLSLVGMRVLHLQGVALYSFAGLAFIVLIALSYASLTFFETPARRFLSKLGNQRRQERGALLAGDRLAP